MFALYPRKMAGCYALLCKTRLGLLMRHVVAASIGGADRLPSLGYNPLPSGDSQTIGRVFLAQRRQRHQISALDLHM